MPEHYKHLEKFNLDANQTHNFTCVRQNIPYEILFENNLIHSQEIIEKLVNNGIKHIILTAKQNNSHHSILYEIFQIMFDTTGNNHLLSIEALTFHLREEIKYFNQVIGDIEGLTSPFTLA